MHAGVREAPTSLGARLRACGGAKLLLYAGLTLGICAPYFGLQQLVTAAPWTPTATALDLAIPFAPAWVWAYVSLGALVPLAPALATRRSELRTYAVGLAALCLPCFAIFALFPVLGPRPALAPDAGLYGWIVSVDRPLHSLPSLHAGLTTYSLLFADRVLSPSLTPAARGAARALGLSWGAAILFSTLATKQHWAIDLPPGIALAALAYGVAAAGRRRVSD